jgi:hypothetical protein
MTQENGQQLNPTKPRRAFLDERLYQSTDEWKRALQGDAPLVSRMSQPLGLRVRVLVAVGRTLSLLVGQVKQ